MYKRTGAHCPFCVEKIMDKKKRFVCAVLALGILLSVLAPAKQVKAAAIAAEVGAEIGWLIWDLLISTVIAGGAYELSAGDYETEAALYSSYLDSCMEKMEAGESFAGTTFELQDGTFVRMDHWLTSYVGGSEAPVPTLEEWEARRASFEVIEGGGGTSDNGDDNNNDDDTDLLKSPINSAFITADVIETAAAVAQNAILGMNPQIPLGTLTDATQFVGYQYNEAGNILIKGSIGAKDIEQDAFDLRYHTLFFDNVANANPIAFVASTGDYNYDLTFYEYDVETGAVEKYPIRYEYGSCIDGSLTPAAYYRISGAVDSTGRLDKEHLSGLAVRMNIPVFMSYDDMVNFFQGIDTSGMLNGAAYDFPGVCAGALEALHPLTGINLNPSSIPQLRQALSSNLANAADADPDNQPQNTQDYIGAVQGAVDSALGTDPSGNPGSNPGVEPDSQPESVEPPEDLKKYRTDLTSLFPFCLPFDLIALLDVLDAEPEAPVFEIPLVVPALNIHEVYELDLSIFNETMEVFRVCVLVTFILGLIIVTSKMIKW